jgi:PAS domain S-box-containing protein
MSIFTKSEEFFQLLIENSTSVFQIVDAGIIITYSNGAIEGIIGFSPKELTGRKLLDMVHPDDREQVRDTFISIRSRPEKLHTLEYRLKNKQDEWVWVENTARNMLNNATLKGIVMTYRNVQSKKVADQALVQAEQRLSLLLNNTEESFIILNSRLRILTYNRAAQEHSPYFFNHELQSGLSLLDLINKEEISEYINLFEQVFLGNELEKETRSVDVNDQLHIYHHIFRPLFDEKKDIFGVFITSTDITERKQLTEELATNTERLKSAQQIAKLGYYEYDFTLSTFFCSPQFYDILGISPSNQKREFFDKIETVLNVEDREAVRKKVEKSIKKGVDFNTEFRVVMPDGSEKVILALGSSTANASGPEKFRVTLQDITASKMAMLAIETLESKFKSLFESSIDGVLISNENGDFISANPAYCSLLGYDAHEITSLNRADVLDMKSPATVSILKQRSDTGAYIGEVMLKRKDGHYIPAEVTSIVLKDAHGQTYISSIVRDITEKKKIEAEQQALTEELMKNNQDLQQFSFITSHNLRAPVANLMSLLSLYNKENPADEFNYLLIDKFQESTEQLNSTLNDLINILVIKSNVNIEKEVVNFSAVFNDVKMNVTNLIEQENVSIDCDFSEVDEIKYNRIHIESLFQNMVTNAIRYRSPDRTPMIKLTSYNQKEWVIVAFTDNGLGMDLKRYGDRLFGLYQRFHENKEGKGLGLYMTRSQVLAMGGKIEVDSEPGKGTTFSVYFKKEQ